MDFMRVSQSIMCVLVSFFSLRSPGPQSCLQGKCREREALSASSLSTRGLSSRLRGTDGKARSCWESGFGVEALGFDSTFSAYCVAALSPMDILRLCFLMYELVIIILLVLMCYKYPQLSFRRAAM